LRVKVLTADGVVEVHEVRAGDAEFERATPSGSKKSIHFVEDGEGVVVEGIITSYI
jgi:hypothetical protein